jgi:hypothetical protein
MEALLTAIVVWLSANYPLPATFSPPRVELVPSSQMANLRYKGLSSSRVVEISSVETREASVEQMRDTVTVYNDQTKIIYLSDKWIGRTPAELSVLVHEMVHHLQYEAGTKYECAAEREKLAYEAQEKWLNLFGRNLEGEFNINGLALLVSTSCAMAMGLH